MSSVTITVLPGTADSRKGVGFVSKMSLLSGHPPNVSVGAAVEFDRGAAVGDELGDDVGAVGAVGLTVGVSVGGNSGSGMSITVTPII